MRKERWKQAKVVRVFLSHSHADRDLAQGLTLILEDFEADLYVDIRDNELPEQTGPETAERIKGKIGASQKFIVLLTSSSGGSKWVPWELGIADSLLGMSNVAIFPLTSFAGFNGLEYLQMYHRFENSAMNLLSVYSPDKKQGVPFSWWLHDKSVGDVRR
jgi:hypothetical protein